MQDVQVAGTNLEECPRCGGLWISVEGFAHICSDPTSQEAAEAMKLPPPTPVDMQKRYLNCPQCSNPMGPMNYAGGSGIILHVCRGHGMWLDRDELKQAIEFNRTGQHDHLHKEHDIRAHDQAIQSWGQAPLDAAVFHGLFNAFNNTFVRPKY
jgi:Zn-finger nucleic acid-binding protein